MAASALSCVLTMPTPVRLLAAPRELWRNHVSARGRRRAPIPLRAARAAHRRGSSVNGISPIMSMYRNLALAWRNNASLCRAKMPAASWRLHGILLPFRLCGDQKSMRGEAPARAKRRQARNIARRRCRVVCSKPGQKTELSSSHRWAGGVRRASRSFWRKCHLALKRAH